MEIIIFHPSSLIKIMQMFVEETSFFWRKTVIQCIDDTCEISQCFPYKGEQYRSS